MKKFFITIVIMCSFFVLSLTKVNAQLIPVDVELALGVDASGSVSTTDYNLMLQGYVNAFNPATNPDIVNIIQGGDNGAIAVSLFLFSEGQKQLQDVNQVWWYIDDSASSLAFSNAIAGLVRPSPGDPFYLETYISNAINYAVPLYNNQYDGQRQVLDITGEGTDDTGETALQTAVSDALAAGVDTINGIVIENGPYSAGFLADYFADYVIGGDNAFVQVAATYDDFGDSIQKKIEKEISPVVPEPISLFLFGAGFAGLIAARKKK